jgi:hypothetical protein
MNDESRMTKYLCLPEARDGVARDSSFVIRASTFSRHWVLRHSAFWSGDGVARYSTFDIRASTFIRHWVFRHSSLWFRRREIDLP